MRKKLFGLKLPVKCKMVTEQQALLRECLQAIRTSSCCLSFPLGMLSSHAITCPEARCLLTHSSAWTIISPAACALFPAKKAWKTGPCLIRCRGEPITVRPASFTAECTNRVVRVRQFLWQHGAQSPEHSGCSINSCGGNWKTNQQ